MGVQEAALGSLGLRGAGRGNSVLRRQVSVNVHHTQGSSEHSAPGGRRIDCPQEMGVTPIPPDQRESIEHKGFHLSEHYLLSLCDPAARLGHYHYTVLDLGVLAMLENLLHRRRVCFPGVSEILAVVHE